MRKGRTTEIALIDDPRKRKIFFNKRRPGIIKKAMELSLLTDCNIFLAITTPEGGLHEYSSNGNKDSVLAMLQLPPQGTKIHRFSNDDYRKTTPPRRASGSQQPVDTDELSSADSESLPSFDALKPYPPSPAIEQASSHLHIRASLASTAPLTHHSQLSQESTRVCVAQSFVRAERQPVYHDYTCQAMAQMAQPQPHGLPTTMVHMGGTHATHHVVGTPGFCDPMAAAMFRVYEASPGLGPGPSFHC